MRVASSMLVLAAAMALPVGARAAEADTMSVTGEISAHNACAMSIQNGGHINYGIIPASSLHEYNRTPMDLKTLGVSITCATPTYIAISLHDLRGGSNTELILGEVNAGGWVGDYQIQHAAAVTVNGTVGHMVHDPHPGPTPGAFWYNAYHLDPWWLKTEWRSFAYVPEGAAVAQPITSAQFTLHIHAAIRELSELQLTGALRIDGQFIMEMMYM